MTDENKDICPETPETPDLPETPEAAPEEPKEVVSWYIPQEPQGREVVSYYVQRDPMPQNVWQQAAKKEKRRSRLWLWISLAVLAVTVAAVVLAAILGGSSGSGQHRPLPDGDGDNPSSIVDIFGSKATSIPRIQGDPGVRLACRDPQGQPLTAQEVYAKVNPSVVTVVSEQSEGASIGTGVIMTSDGYIITNAHVISGGKSCWVALDTGVTYEVNLVGFDEEEDLAVLKADPQNPLPAAEFGNSDLVQVGDTAYAIGNPLGVELRGTMTNGIISAVNRAVEVDGKTMTLLQTSAALNNGNSGGPLINEYGQVIGINTLKMSTTDSTEATVEGLGFALPISSVSFVVNDLIANGHYRGAPSLGITVTTVEKDGGGIAPTGGYIVGRKDLVELCAYRLNAPGLGKELGCTLETPRDMYLGFYYAPGVVCEAIKTAIYAQCMLELLGKKPIPRYCEDHNDIVTCFDAGTAEALIGFCQGIQAASPVDSYAAPEPSPEPGYTDEVVMASGSFTQGSTIELSCDGPLRAPYTCYLQGGLNFAASRAGVLLAIQKAYFKE